LQQAWRACSRSRCTARAFDRQPEAAPPVSSNECRLVVLDLWAGESLADHRVRERAVIEDLSGRVMVESAAATVERAAGSRVTFDPGERHAVRGLEDTRMLLMLAPRPAVGHNAAAEAPHDQHLPANATVESLD
jgi:quercetin dioxygenase-like cupin family protein